MKPAETPLAAARRALNEELGIDHPNELVPRNTKFTFESRPIVSSSSFPGLFTRRTQYFLDVNLPKNVYLPEGYIEDQPDKTTYFIWVDLPNHK